MSSAILYLAIVAIWACVLIPRWLRRDSARGASAPATDTVPSDETVPADFAEPGLPDDDSGEDYTDTGTDGGTSETRRPTRAAVRTAEPVSAEESRRRMLAARRRLLLMLIGLEIAAIALAVLRLAALWVVVPPTLMLAGYLLLLREAAQADAERAQYEAQALALALAREREREQYAQARRVTPADGTLTTGIPDAAAALAAKFAAAPVPADYEDSAPGRDFAPGLAGKYTTSNADAEGTDEDSYEGYEAPRLRAVGD